MNNKKCILGVRKAKMGLTTALIKLYGKRHRIAYKSNAQSNEIITKQESCAVARKLSDAAADLFGLKFAYNIHYKFKSS